MDHSPGFLKLAEAARARVNEISVDEVGRQLSQRRFRLIDVREDREWDAGHLEGAEHLGKGVIERDVEKIIPNKSAELVLYCGGGYRSAMAADALQQMGYTNVLSMAGGFRSWTESGGDVVKG